MPFDSVKVAGSGTWTGRNAGYFRSLYEGVACGARVCANAPTASSAIKHNQRTDGAGPGRAVMPGVSPHFSHTFEPRAVAQALLRALLRAASALLPTPGLDAMLLAGDGVETSLDTARRSACATLPRGV